MSMKKPPFFNVRKLITPKIMHRKDAQCNITKEPPLVNKIN